MSDPIVEIVNGMPVYIYGDPDDGDYWMSGWHWCSACLAQMMIVREMGMATFCCPLCQVDGPVIALLPIADLREFL